MLHFLLFSFAVSYILRWKKKQKPSYQWNENIEYVEFSSDISYYHLPAVLKSIEDKYDDVNEDSYHIIHISIYGFI